MIRLGDALEQQVAALVAERIVDALEFVEIEKEDRKFSSVPPIALQRFLDSLLEQVAVRQSGQAVEMRHLLDLSLGVLAIGDVLVRRDPAAVLQRVVDDGDRAAVGKQMLRRINFVLRQPLRAHGHVAIGILIDISGLYLIGEELAKRPSHGDQFGRESIYFCKPIVPDDQLVVAVIHRNALRNMTERGVELPIHRL